MIEESYRQRAEESKLLRTIATNPMAVASELFSGRVRVAGGAIASPSLFEHVAPRAAESSEILKQQRKALEARGLPRRRQARIERCSHAPAGVVRRGRAGRTASMGSWGWRRAFRFTMF